MAEGIKVLCVSPDMAVDKTAVIPDLTPGKTHRPSGVLSLAGGKGCNCARVLKTLGAQPTVTGWAGGHNGRFIEEGMWNEGIATHFVRIRAESRMCLAIVDPDRRMVTEINETNPFIDPEQVEMLFRVYQHLLPGFDLVTLSGKLPPGVPVDFYARLIETAHAFHKPVLLDTYGQPLRQALPARPTLIKPNLAEFCELTGEVLSTPEEAMRAAIQIARQYGIRVVVTLGAQGMVAAEPGECFSGLPPAVEAVNATGSGDAFLAGLAYRMAEGAPFVDALRLGLAASAANTLHLGAGVLRRAQVNEIYARTEVSSM